MGRFLLFWGMQPVGGKCGGVRGLFAAVRRMRHDKSLWKAPRVERSAVLSYFLMSRTILPQARQRWAMGR